MNTIKPHLDVKKDAGHDFNLDFDTRRPTFGPAHSARIICMVLESLLDIIASTNIRTPIPPSQ